MLAVMTGLFVCWSDGVFAVIPDVVVVVSVVGFVVVVLFCYWCCCCFSVLTLWCTHNEKWTL